MGVVNLMVCGLKRHAQPVLLMSLLAAGVSLGAAANLDNGSWSFDSDHSSATLFIGSKDNPTAINVGAARLIGTVRVDPINIKDSSVDINMFPANEDWLRTLRDNGRLPAGYIPDASDNVLLTFRSKHFQKTARGELKVEGDLTLTTVERTVTADPNEAFAGPVYAQPVLHSVTHTATFLFPNLGGSSVADSRNAGERQVSAFAHIWNEDFSGLTTAIGDTYWPPVIADENCNNPSTVGEDYRGPVCSGTSIAVSRMDHCHIPSTVGEDYHGYVCSPPDGDEVSVVLTLKFKHRDNGKS